MAPQAVFWLLVLGAAAAAAAGGQCGWSGSGLSSSTERGVTPVLLRCGAGAVAWRYPRGALRLVFRPPLPAGQQDFTLCVRVARRPDPPDLFHELAVNDTKAARFPARLFVEGARALLPLYAADDGDPRELRCVRSRRGRAALYVEAEPGLGPERTVASFQYEAKPLRRHYDPALAECRPCSDAELEFAFCTSDLVSRGMFVGTEQREDLDSTQLTLRVTKLLRATGGAGGVGGAGGAGAGEDDVGRDDYYRYDVESDNSVEPQRRRRRRRRGLSLHAHVHMPARCGAAAGAGEFLVMARRRLGHLALVCAPRLADWARLVRRRGGGGGALCQLQH